MDKVKFISKGGLRVAVSLAILITVASVYIWVIISSGIYYLFLSSNPDTGWWFDFLLILPLGVAMIIVVKRMWYEVWKTAKGIVIREEGIFIHGDWLPWSDVKAVYANPKVNHVSFLLSRPTSKTATRHVLKKYITSIDHFLESVKECGISVSEDNILDENIHESTRE